MSEVKSKASGSYCCVPGCNSHFYKSGQFSMFRFPKEQERCKQWVNNMGLDFSAVSFSSLYNNVRLCSQHFEENQFMNHLKNSLVWNAIPTIVTASKVSQELVSKCVTVTAKRASLAVFEAIQNKQPKILNHEYQQSNKSNVNKFPCNLPTTPLKQNNKFTQTNSCRHLNFGNLYCKYRRLLSKCTKMQKQILLQKVTINNYRNTISTESCCSCQCHHSKLTETQKSLVQAQAQSSVRKLRGMRWLERHKQVGISILYKSPQCYRFLRKLFSLPSPSVLKRYLSDISLLPDIVNPNLIMLLQKQGEKMKDIDRNCVLVFDAMSIKSNLLYDKHKDCIKGLVSEGYGTCQNQIATYALVIMVRGLASNWKFVVGYIFINNTIIPFKLKCLIDRVVITLECKGFHIHGCVMDLEVNQQSFCKKYGQGDLKNWISHPSDVNRKFWIIFDPPHLLKCIRNNFTKYAIQFVDSDVDSKCARWKHVEDLWNYEKECEIRLCPKLTEMHINVGPFDKLKVNLAAQILSHSVSCALRTYVHFQVLPPEVLPTADFVEMVNNLFDMLNNSFHGAKNNFKKVFNKNEEHHLEGLLTFKRFVSSWKLVSEEHGTPNKSNAPFKQCMLVTIQSIYELTQHLFTCHSFQYFCSRRCNQDCVENCFSVIRSKGMQRDNPTSDQFEAAIKNVIMCEALSHLKPVKSNCQIDDDVFLNISSVVHSVRLNGCAVHDHVDVERQENVSAASFKNIVMSLSPVNLITNNIVYYISGYIAKKLILVQKCDNCNVALSKTFPTFYDENIFIRFKQYDYLSFDLTAPSYDLFFLCLLLENIFRKFTNNILSHSKHSYANFKSIVNQHVYKSHYFMQCDLHGMYLFNSISKIYFVIRISFLLKTRRQRLNYQLTQKRRSRKIFKMINNQRVLGDSV